jgi:hypothetical protein
MYAMMHHMERTMPTEYKPTVPQLLGILDEHPNVVESLEPAGEVASRFKITGMSKGIFVAYHYAMACADSAMADEFYTQLATGLDVEEHSPVYSLREKYGQDMTKVPEKRMKRYEGCAFLVTAWEATREGRRLAPRDFRFVRGGKWAQAVPTVSGVDWLPEE